MTEENQDIQQPLLDNKESMSGFGRLNSWVISQKI